MQYCTDPYVRFERGAAKAVGVASQKVDRQAVACGRCAACISNRKQDWTGKLLGEAETSAACAFVTLTYKHEPEKFRYDHIQAMLKRLREYMWRHHKCGVRFFCVAERGDKFGRKHWHLILFFTRPIDLRRTTPKRLWTPSLQEGKDEDDDRLPFWEHGWTSLEMLGDIDRRAQKMRYCVMYALKGVGFSAGERARCSLNPALGSEYVGQQARKWVDAGLPPNGKFQIPGVRWTTGHKAGQLQTFSLQGANRRTFIRIWRDWWTCLHPEREHPVNDWVLKWDDRAVDGVHAKAVLRASKRPAAPLVRQTARSLVERQALDITERAASRYIAGDGWTVELSKLPDGRAVLDVEGRLFSVVWSIAEVLDLDTASVVRIDKWLRDQRDPDWRPRDLVEEELKADEQKRQRRAFLREAVLLSRERLRSRHGTVRGAGGIFSRPFVEGSRDPFWDRPRAAFPAPVAKSSDTDIPCSYCGVLHPRRGSCREGCDTEAGLARIGLQGQQETPF